MFGRRSSPKPVIVMTKPPSRILGAPGSLPVRREAGDGVPRWMSGCRCAASDGDAHRTGHGISLNDRDEGIDNTRVQRRLMYSSTTKSRWTRWKKSPVAWIGLRSGEAERWGASRDKAKLKWFMARVFGSHTATFQHVYGYIPMLLWYLSSSFSSASSLRLLLKMAYDCSGLRTARA